MLNYVITKEVPDPDKVFPCIRRWEGMGANPKYPLVVLFTGPRTGVALTEGERGPERIGKEEVWAEYSHEGWTPCTITMRNMP